MDIREAQVARSTLERIVLEHIAKFEHDTGLHVESVDLIPTQAIGDRLPSVQSLSIATQL